MAYDGVAVRRQAERLDSETERALVCEWQECGDVAAMHRLVIAHMPLALGRAAKMRRAGIEQDDLQQEAMLGIIKAAGRFSHSHGNRFAAYAQGWVGSSLQDRLMRDTFVVRTASKQYKQLFFQMSKLQSQIESAAMARGERLTQYEVCQEIARRLNMSVAYVVEINGRLSEPDQSLNAPMSTEVEGETWLDALADPSPQAAELHEARCNTENLRAYLISAMEVLDEREFYIVCEYKVREQKRTFREIGEELKISWQFVSQIYHRAIKKIRKELLSKSFDVRLFLT